MEFEAGYMQALMIVGSSFLVFMLALIMDEINKKKAICGYILAVVLLALGIYSYILVGQYQQEKKPQSFNKLNHYLYIYRIPQQSAFESPSLSSPQ
ncbi:MAG: hypothetical protein NC823_01840 [Candidatus Omnitrophica bacterium]|nr:hypothetical protein [Candidatus Omnitrophota bacterium]